MLRQTKKQKGITLIALVITVIVLLILAAVTINALSGDNGILRRAREAKEKTGASQEEESVKVSVTEALTQGIGELTTENLKKAVKNNGLNEQQLAGNGPWTYNGEYNEYNIETSGKMTSIPQDVATDKIVDIVGSFGLTKNKRLLKLNFGSENDIKVWKEVQTGEQIEGIQKVKEIEEIKDVGFRMYFVLDENGDVYMLDDFRNITPQKIDALSNIDQIYCNYMNLYAKTASGEVYAWGNNDSGQLGIGNTTDQSAPVKINGLTNVQNIDIENGSIYAITKTGDVYAWGDNDNGQLGIGNTTNQSIPVKINELTNVQNIDFENGSIYAITKTGDVYAWGSNRAGKLGIGNNTDQNVPVKINGLTNIQNIDFENGSIYAITKTGDVYAWGSNRAGKLGIGNNTDQNVPVKINELSNVEDIYSGKDYAYAKTTAGDVYAWGNNRAGKLGIGNNIDQNVPVKINGLKNIEKIFNINYGSMYAKSITGEIYVWGNNCWKELGLGQNSESFIVNPTTLKSVDGSNQNNQIVSYFECATNISQNGKNTNPVTIITIDGKVYQYLSEYDMLSGQPQ